MMMSLLKDLKAIYSTIVMYVHCDDGENKAIEQLCKTEGMDVNFIYTLPCTPQQKGRIERKLAFYLIGYMLC